MINIEQRDFENAPVVNASEARVIIKGVINDGLQPGDRFSAKTAIDLNGERVDVSTTFEIKYINSTDAGVVELPPTRVGIEYSRDSEPVLIDDGRGGVRRVIYYRRRQVEWALDSLRYKRVQRASVSDLEAGRWGGWIIPEINQRGSRRLTQLGIEQAMAAKQRQSEQI